MPDHRHNLPKATGSTISKMTMGHKNGGAKAGTIYVFPWQQIAA
jgi:hypothetical protein